MRFQCRRRIDDHIHRLRQFFLELLHRWCGFLKSGEIIGHTINRFRPDYAFRPTGVQRRVDIQKIHLAEALS